ncbi:MAG: hypothetical protein WCK10_04130, partial [Candidatus Staskawiczbacteria bacterium]
MTPLLNINITALTPTPGLVSSFNLGISITAISILVSLAALSLDTRLNLRYTLRKIFINTVIYLTVASIISTFVAEFSNTFEPFNLQILGAIFMLLAIFTYFFIVFIPFRKFNKYNIRLFIIKLNKLLVQKNKDDLSKYLEDIVYFYDNLLLFSLENDDAKMVFDSYLSSNLFLTYFSEHGYLFETTIKFYSENYKNMSEDKLRHITSFINVLMAKSLNNQDSFLNNFLNEDIYPNSSSYLNELFLRDFSFDYSRNLFGEVRYNNLGIDGKISYIKMAGNYFKFIHRNNMSRTAPGGYEKKIDYNDHLIFSFFSDIEGFFESEYEQENLKKLLKAISNISWDYTWGVRNKDKSEQLKKKTGEFYYEI